MLCADAFLCAGINFYQNPTAKELLSDFTPKQLTLSLSKKRKSVIGANKVQYLVATPGKVEGKNLPVLAKPSMPR
jgi:hypothetical protein